ncbi:hypothetical protein [Bifidobacterium longum]|uniref:hypothetical protein n=1 Tax=Bifidobacterium longum TaxID=216816 RepID=UPI0032449452
MKCTKWSCRLAAGPLFVPWYAIKFDAVERRSSNHPDEDWLVCITTDHGHLDEGGHGGADPVLRRSFFGALRLGVRSSDQYSFESMRPEQIAGWMLRHLDTPIQ